MSILKGNGKRNSMDTGTRPARTNTATQRAHQIYRTLVYVDEIAGDKVTLYIPDARQKHVTLEMVKIKPENVQIEKDQTYFASVSLGETDPDKISVTDLVLAPLPDPDDGFAYSK